MGPGPRRDVPIDHLLRKPSRSTLAGCLAGLCLGLAAAPARPGAAGATGPASPIDAPAVRRSLQEADSELERFVEEWIRIAEIPAPSGGEADRAHYLERRFRELGLDQVAIDAAGNVVGLMRGKDPSLKKVALMAHMDTVAPATADHTVHRVQGGRRGILRGPGVRDDSSGLAGLVAAISLMRRHGLEPPADTWVVASAREEIGLQGAEHFTRERSEDLGALIALDGQLGQISYAATGIVWMKLHFLAPGGHTLKSHENPSAIMTAARAIERIGAIPMRRSPETMETWLNIGAMGGGDVPNAQARDAWFTVDLRSNDRETFDQLERRVEETARETAREAGVGFEKESLHRMAGGTIPRMLDSPLVLSARRVLEDLGWEPIHLTPRGTADHNVAIVRGIPGIAIGVTTGDGAHTPDEYADVAPFSAGIKQIVLLALMPLTTPAS